MKYYIIPRPRTEFAYEADNAEDAMVNFATSMDMDMNIYFVAVPEDQYEEYCHQEDAKAHERFVKAFMKDTVTSDFRVYDEDIASDIADRAYEIYSEGDGDTEYESIQKAYDERYNAKITISNIQWDWDRESLSDTLARMSSEAVNTLFKAATGKDWDTAGMTDEDVISTAEELLKNNKLSPEQVFDLPETAEVPSILDDEQISEYLADEYGYCVKGYSRSDDEEVE